MKKYYKEFLTYSYAERKGIIGLLIVIIVVLISIRLTDYFGNREVTDFSQFDRAVEQFNHASTSQNESKTETITDEIDNPDKKYSMFNPNSASDEDFMELGLNVKQINVIRNYLSKGGRFRNKDDFKKMYCISEAEYNLLSPYISIPKELRDSTRKSFEKSKTTYLPKTDITLELNSADTITLTQLHGIGTVYARRIVKYRDLLGGFANKEQLFEVYSFDTLHYNQIEEHITIDIGLVKKININSASFDELKRHPYIKTPLANAIIKYRKAHGNYKEIDELKKLVLMDDGLFIKLAPYLKVNQIP